MRAYIIEYRLFEIGDGHIEQVLSHISQVGYSSLEAAQEEIKKRPNSPVKVTPMLFQTACCEKYAIHDILIEDSAKRPASPAPLAAPPRPAGG